MSKNDIQPNETKSTIKIRGVYPQTKEHLYEVYAAPIKFKKLHPDAVTPTHAYFGDAGFDLTAVGKKIDRTNRCIYTTSALPLRFHSAMPCSSSLARQHTSMMHL